MKVADLFQRPVVTNIIRHGATPLARARAACQTRVWPKTNGVQRRQSCAYCRSERKIRTSRLLADHGDANELTNCHFERLHTVEVGPLLHQLFQGRVALRPLDGFTNAPGANQYLAR